MRKLIALSILVLTATSGCMTKEDPFSYEIPMYGGAREAKEEKQEELSQEAIREGWEYLYIKKDCNNAMKYFNEAWYYNCDNPNAYWGIGVVLETMALQENNIEKLEKAIKILEKANAMDQLNPSIMNALGKAMMENAVCKSSEEDKQTLLKASEELFNTSCRINPRGIFYYNWSVCLYHQERYEDAWIKLLKANELNHKIPPEYLASIKAKLKKQKTEGQ